MAEVTVPEESTEETPTEEETIVVDKPTDKSKVISVNFNPLDTKVTTNIDTHEGFFTTDTDAWIVLNIAEMSEPTGQYSLALINKEDGSIFQRTGDIVSGVAYYKMIQDEIKHAGRWTGQVVITLDNGQTTASRFSFAVAGHILDGKDVRQIVIQDFQTLMAQLNSLKDIADVDLSTLLSSVESAQTLAVENELERQETFTTNESARQVEYTASKTAFDENLTELSTLIETDVVGLAVDEKYGELEETYATNLTNLKTSDESITAQLAQTPTYEAVWNMDNMGQDVRTAMTNGSVAVVGENTVQRINMSDGSVSINKLDNTMTQLMGLEKVVSEWIVGAIQTGSINLLAKDAVSTNNFIYRDYPIIINLVGDNLEYFLGNYIDDTNAYTGALVAWNSNLQTIVPVIANQKIKISIRHKDRRLLSESDKNQLLTSINVYKETTNSINQLSNRINEVNEDVSGMVGSLDVPSYWESHLDSKINTVKSLQKKVGYNGTSFAFITDTHWNDNSQKSPLLLRKIIKECEIPYVIDGGDLASNPIGVSKTEHIKELIDYKEHFSFLDTRVLRTKGNHDDNSINTKYSATVTDTDFYDIMYRQNSVDQKIKSGKDGHYSFIDDEMHKIRYITLNSIDIPYVEGADDSLIYSGMIHADWAFRQEQIDWFADKALNVPSNDWSVVICSHVPINHGTTKNDSIAMNILQAFKDKAIYSGSLNVGTDFAVNKDVDYTNAGGNVVCWISGHLHLDKEIVFPNNINFKSLVSLNDSLNSKEGTPIKTLGTITENAFDIFTIDKINRKVNITRIGAGSDREFMY